MWPYRWWRQRLHRRNARHGNGRLRNNFVIPMRWSVDEAVQVGGLSIKLAGNLLKAAVEAEKPESVVEDTGTEGGTLAGRFPKFGDDHLVGALRTVLPLEEEDQ